MPPPWIIAGFLVLCLAAPLAFGKESSFPELRERVIAGAQRLSADLATRKGDPGLPNPDVRRTPPPRHVTEAPPIFVEAWKERERFRSHFPPTGRATTVPKVVEPRIPIDNYGRTKEFVDFLEALLDPGQAPPAIGEAYRFHFTSYPGKDYGDDTRARDAGRILCHLRNNDARGALYATVGTPRTLVRRNLLRHFGFDSDLVRLGDFIASSNAWKPAGPLCEYPNERIAVALLDWVEANWDRYHRYRMATREGRHDLTWTGPPCPTIELMKLLLPGNGVSDSTKQRLADWVAARGIELQPRSVWLLYTPRGGEKWMVEYARESLDHPTNEMRRHAARVLERAGVDFDPPEKIVGPRYRLFVNGTPWPGDLDIDGHRLARGVYGSIGPGRRSTDVRPIERGSQVYEADPDPFADLKEKSPVVLKVYPGSGTKSGPVSGHPWLRVSIPGPPKFGETVDVDFTTFPLTVDPRYPDDGQPDGMLENSFTLQEFFEGRENYGSSMTYRFRQGGSLVIRHLSPGKYRYRLSCPGMEAVPRGIVEVQDGPVNLAPELTAGVTLVVPLDWGSGNRVDLYPHAHALPVSQSSMFLLFRDGRVVTTARPSRLPKDRGFPRYGVFGGLAPGSYELVTRVVDVAITRDGEKWSWMRTEKRRTKIVVPKDSGRVKQVAPLEVTLKPGGRK